MPGRSPTRESCALEAHAVSRRFGDRVVLRDISLRLRPGDIHALLGPNGAGKTTLMRVISGLADPTGGEVVVLGRNTATAGRALAGRVGLVPSGDRTFYLRLNGLENLRFFARLHGVRRRAALLRARELLEVVGLADAAMQPVGRYSHGMQKRLSFARALITDPGLLLVDEATHDLDPEGARRIRRLTAELALRGTAVLWTTQRVEEIRGFAGGVTLLDRGEVRYAGPVDGLLERAGGAPRYLLQVRNGHPGGVPDLGDLRRAVGEAGTLQARDAEHVALTPAAGKAMGDAIVALAHGGYRVVACRHEGAEVEEAFLALTQQAAP